MRQLEKCHYVMFTLVVLVTYFAVSLIGFLIAFKDVEKVSR